MLKTVRPETELFTDLDDIINALHDFKKSFQTALASDVEFVKMYTGVDDRQRDRDKKTTTEHFLRHIHSGNFDVSWHDAVPSFASKLCGLPIKVHDKYGTVFLYGTTGSDNETDQGRCLNFRQMADGHFQLRTTES